MHWPLQFQINKPRSTPAVFNTMKQTKGSDDFKLSGTGAGTDNFKNDETGSDCGDLKLTEIHNIMKQAPAVAISI